MKRKWFLVAVFVLLLGIDAALSFVAKNDDIELTLPTNWFSLVVTAAWVLLLWDTWRGSRLAANVLVGFHGLVGVALLVAAFFVPHGPAQIAASALVNLAIACVLLLLRDEIHQERQVQERLAEHWEMPAEGSRTHSVLRRRRVRLTK